MKGLNLLQKRKLGKGIHHRKLKKGEKGYKRKMEEVIMGYRRGKEQDSIWRKYSIHMYEYKGGRRVCRR